MLIRKAQTKDAKRISYLIQKNTDRVQENNYSPEQMEAWKKANTTGAILEGLKSRLIFCAFQKEQLVGTIGLQGSLIVGLYVAYSKRGKGIGKVLLQHLEEYAKANKLRTLELSATPAGFPFYSKNGYVREESVVVNINGVDFKETQMSKKIK